MNKITRITTVRHGQTAYNVERRYAGSIDVPLNERGIKEAKSASVRLTDYDFEIVVTSKLKRAIQTAELLTAGRHLPIIQTELCNERNYGKMEGLNYIEVENINPHILYCKINNDFHSLNPPHGETFPALSKRANAFSQFLFENYSGSDILVVSSSAFLQQLHGVFRDYEWYEALRDDIQNLRCISFTFNNRKLIEEMPANLLVENW